MRLGWLAIALAIVSNGCLGISDVAMCALLRSYPELIAAHPEALDFLCDQNGLGQLRENEFVDHWEENLGIQSKYIYGTHLSVLGELERFENVSQLFCSDFETYRNVAPKTFEKVDTVTASDVSDLGCQYHFLGKWISFVRPEFYGRIRYFSNFGASMFIFSNTLEKHVSMVRDHRDLIFAVAEPSGHISVYSVFYSFYDTLGAHQTTKEYLHEAAKNLREGFISEIASWKNDL